MKHVFIINPNAGNSDPSARLVPEIREVFSSLDEEYDIHLTTGTGDAINYVTNICQKSACQVRFYACGGDGTINEVVNGIYGFKNASVSSIPCGSGNDFVKSIPKYTDLKRLVQQGQEHYIDAIDVNGRLCVNLTCLGFDADVNYSADKYKKLPFIKGGASYNLAIIERLFCKMGHELTLEFDNGEIIKGNFLLSVFANGQFYGGQYRGAPLAEIDDGLIDVGLVRTLSRFKIVSLISYYSKGEHVNNPIFSDIVIYRKTTRVTVKSAKPVILNLDGEQCRFSEVTFSILPRAVRLFVAPSDSLGYGEAIAAAKLSTYTEI